MSCWWSQVIRAPELFVSVKAIRITLFVASSNGQVLQTQPTNQLPQAASGFLTRSKMLRKQAKQKELHRQTSNGFGRDCP